MNALVFPLLAILASAGDPAVPENTLLKELVEKGVEMPDGQVVPLPAPMMAEGLSAQEQAEVLAKAAALGRSKPPKFLEKLSNAPVTLRTGKIPSKVGLNVIRTVNLYFVVYGDWNVLKGDQFSKSILKEGKATNGNEDNVVSKAGYLKPPELAVRKLATRSTTDVKEYFLYTTLRLFDRVELSATRFGSATITPAGVIVAAKVDPRFAKDKQYPNQWREITKDPQGKAQLGPPQPYSGAAFYAKVTRLIKPQDAIFVEFHQVFYEPRAWFGEDDNLTPAELRRIIPFQVKQFRIKLLRASMEEVEKK